MSFKKIKHKVLKKKSKITADLEREMVVLSNASNSALINIIGIETCKVL